MRSGLDALTQDAFIPVEYADRRGFVRPVQACKARHARLGSNAVAEIGSSQHGIADEVRAEIDRDMRREAEEVARAAPRTVGPSVFGGDLTRAHCSGRACAEAGRLHHA